MKFLSSNSIILGLIVFQLISLIPLLMILFDSYLCTQTEDCIDSVLHIKPQLSLNIYSSPYSYPVGLDVIHNEEDFNYMVPRQMKLVLPIHEETRQNGSLFLHLILNSPRIVRYPGTYYEIIQEPFSVYIKVKLTHYAVPKIAPFYLLSNEQKSSVNEENSKKLVSHLRNHVHLRMTTDNGKLSTHNLPSELANKILVTKDGKLAPIFHHYFPKTWYTDLVKISPKDEEISVTVDYAPTSIRELGLLLTFENRLGMKTFRFTDKDVAELEGMFINTNPYFLGGTVAISLTSIAFGFLTLEYDADYWDRKNSFRGLNARTVLWHVFGQMIIFLYQLEEQCLTIFLMFTGFGIFSDLWKSRESLKMKLVTDQGWLPRIKFQNNDSTPDEKGVRIFQNEVKRYLSRLLYPLVIGGAAYSLVFQPYKSWYSWTIHSLVHGVYAFDFLFMFSQLLKNYKLKSVPYIPWRAFSSKVCYTFIDDAFAFAIPMPTAYRISCFRDDFVFLIEIYQRWIYPVDKSDKNYTVAKDETSTPNEMQDKKEN